MPKPIIQHIHLRGLTHYAQVSALQSALVSRLLAYKKSAPTTTAPPPPPPTILTFSPYPTYTHGRRDPLPPTPKQLSVLLSPLETAKYGTLKPTFSNDLRGGQTTFHGPGQLVVWPVFSLDRPYSFEQHQEKQLGLAEEHEKEQDLAKRQRLSPTQYVCLLEGVTINTLKNIYGLPSKRTADPGVWTLDGERKIAALGVHLRRNVTSFGVGLNVETDGRWWERIVACGLEGKGVTSMLKEGVAFAGAEGKGEERVQEVAGRWVKEFAQQVGADVKLARGKLDAALDKYSKNDAVGDAATMAGIAGLSGAMAGGRLPSGSTGDGTNTPPHERNEENAMEGEIGLDMDGLESVVDVFGDIF